MRICVYCASSDRADPVYREAAFRTGELLAQARCTVVYGGGSAGSMGAVADGALSKGGEVIGILPRFMADLEWGWPGKAQHQGDAAPGQRPDQGCPGWRQGPGTAAGRNGWFTMEYVSDMRERKHRLLSDSDAVIALPGGCGTLEELFEAITLKRLGLYFKPIVLLNTRGFYEALHAFLQQVIAERFMNPEHAAMWSMVNAPGDVLPAIRNAPQWRADARDYAVVR
ncbi:MAG: LOG family protein [Proteobacteria bacterium]|nr:LOG family protein [Pseudomonadota bacterium]